MGQRAVPRESPKISSKSEFSESEKTVGYCSAFVRQFVSRAFNTLEPSVESAAE